MKSELVDLFIQSATKVGATVETLTNLSEAASYIGRLSQGTALVPETPLATRHGLREKLTAAGVAVYEGSFREAGTMPDTGVTFSNFALADSGTVVLESTQEDIRLATTLPEIHFIVVDPATILADNLAAAAPMNELHQGSEPRFVAYISGPSRTADIERVLTIGCHGPRQLHVLLIADISANPMEN